MRHRAGNVITSYSQAPHKVASSSGCLRNFSQADTFGPVPGTEDGGTGGALRYAGLGVELATTVVLGALAGQWADRKTGASGVFTVIGALLGFGVTMYSLIRGLRGAERDEK